MAEELVAPASYAQERVWLDCQVDPELTLYNLVTTADLPGALTVGQINGMLARLVARQEALRTSLQLRDGELVQVVAAQLALPPLPVTDLSAAAPPEQQRRVSQICSVEAATPFVLEQAPLWRARLVRLSTGWQLVFAVHHTIYDGGSATVLYAELRELAAAAREGREPALPELTIQYADFAAWQREQLTGEAGREQLGYWLRQLAGAPPVHSLPLDHPRPAELAHEGDDVFFTLPAGTGRTAEALARSHGATELMVMLAAYVALLAEAGGDADVVVGVPAMGRDRAELRPLIGMFVNTLVIRVDAGGDPSFAELLGRVRDRLFEAWDHQEVPVQTLVKHLVGRRDPSTRPLYQLGFNHLKSFDRGRSHGVARDELLLVVADDEGRIEYRTDLFERDTVERLAERYVGLLGQALTEPQRRLSELREPPRTAAQAGGQQPEPAAGGQRYPLSFSQERMWVLERLAPGDPVYNMPMALRLRGTLHRAALQQALDTVIARHGALRTTFNEVDGEPYQLVAEAATRPVPMEDLSAVAAAERLAVAREVTAAEARAPFDLTAGPLLRVKLLRLADDDHFLLLTMHHIIADGWSVGVLAGELSEAYRAAVTGGEPDLPPLPVGYGDYAAWQRNQLVGEELQRQLGYWTDHLVGAPALLELPTERPRPAEESFAGDRYTFTLSDRLRDGLARLGAQHDATGFMVMLAALQVTLARYSGQDDVVVGTPVAGRTHAELDPLIGLFVNTLALRGRLAGDPTFAQVLAQARETTLGGLSNQELPFEKLVETLQPERSLSHSPIFQVQLIVQNTPQRGLSLPGLEITAESRHTRTAKFDLTVEMASLPGRAVGVAVEYKTDLFSRDWARRFAGCLTAVLEAAVDNPDTRVFDIDVVPREQRDEVLWAPNRTAAPISADTVVPRLVAALADGTVAAGEVRTPLPQVGDLAARLATVLRGLGVDRDALVGLCLDRTAGMLAAMLGVWRAGGAYVPLDPAFPAERLRMMVADSGLRVIVTDRAQQQLAAQLAGTGVVLVNVDDPQVAAAAPQPQPVPLSGDNLAYVIFTSGSTGRPKGVQVPHRPVVNLLDWFADALRLGPADTLVAVTTLSFDIAVLELLLPLWTGSRLVIAGQEQSSDPRLLRRLLDDAQATVMQATPATWRMLVAAGGVPAGVRTRLCGGEALPADLADELVGPQVRLWNVYGPTETTVWSAAGLVAGSPPAIEVGPPIGNTQLYVLDARLLPVPLGVAGEVYIGGAGMTRGYHGRAALTGERFVPDPFSDEPGARMYRTGDLARRLPHGALEFLGRADNQVKVRGFRIETGEIESVLAEHSAVRQAVVTADTSAGETRLVGYVVAAAADATPAELWPQLRPHLRGSLPDYMLPATLVVLPELPLTPNGKIDRRALPAPSWGATSAVAHVAPRTDVERQLAVAWAELLATTDPIGVHDDFFTLGGHSLTATRLVARIRSLFGPQLSLRDVFAGSTIAELATAIVAHPDYGRAPAAGPGPAPAPVAASSPPAAASDPGGLGSLSDQDIDALLQAALRERQARQAAAGPQQYPLSPLQRRLWFLQQLAPDEPLYTVHNHWSLTGAVDPAVVQRVADALIARHPALRTTFTVVDEEPVQVVAPAASADLTVVDLAALPASQRVSAAQQALAEELGRPFDLATGPLARLRLVSAGEEHVLLLNLHHLVADATSAELLRSEFHLLYREYTAGVAADLPPLSTSYGEYARAQYAAAGEQRLAEQLEYWKQQLAGAPALLELPTDRPRPAVQTFHGATHEQPLSPETTSALLALARREGTTPYPLLLAAFQLLLARYSGQRDVLVGTAVSRRPTEDLDPVVGLFVNTVVARADLSGDPTLRELLASARAEHIAALSNADVPFDRVAEALRPDRSAAYTPVFQVMFVYNDQAHLVSGRADSGSPLAELAGLLTPVPAARFDLTLSVGQRQGRLQLMLDYNRDLFDESTVVALARHLSLLIEAFTADLSQRAFEVPLLSAREREELVVDRQPVRAYPQRFAHDLIAAAGQADPSAPALLSGRERLSYAELERRSAQLAGKLRRLGVGPDQPVGLAIPASADALVGVLGILRAGGAYLPLDPGHPAERLAWILADSKASLVVTTADYADRLPAAAVQPVVLEEVPDAPEPAPVVPLHPLNAAYVIYTSGSTGVPKGVTVSHAALGNLTQAFVDLHGFTAEDRLLMIPPLTFDASVGDIFPALVAGAALVLHPEPAALAGKDLLRYCAEQAVTVVDAPCALWQQWVEDLAPGDVPAAHPLSQLMVGGEAVPVEKLRAFARVTGGAVRLVNHYGPTEATVCATTYATVDGSELAGEAQLPAGAPVPNVRCYVLDERLHPVPDGVPGELCLGGAGVARGYLGRAGFTAERFVPDPFSDEPGARLYRTGDRARWRRGLIEFLGRTDTQVKIRGHRVELSEVEAAIAGHPDVREAAVVARGGPGGQRLVGYVAPQPAADLTEADLRSYLRDRLPDYLLPGQLVLLATLPLTSHGKVDRKALPEPPAAPERPAYEAPVGPTEAALAQVWAQVLELDAPVGRYDNFFDLGGHSLLAIPVATRLRQRLGHQPAARLLFQADTLAELATLVERERAAVAAGDPDPAAGVPDLRAEAVLPDDICAGLSPYQPGPLRQVLLTGATGFLGAYLLADLLAHTQAKVYCLVRADSPETAAGRIEANLRRYDLWQPQYAERIVPVPGDLAQTRLGWSPEQFETLAGQLDTIYHNGGVVNFLQPYEWLRPANVTGTREVLRLAGLGRTTPVHFVSTLGVFLSDAYRSGQVSEGDVPTDPAGMYSAYNQSKWVADALVRAAAGRGLPVTVHRPARISGDRRTGAGNSDDYFSRMLKTYVQLGSVPLWESETDLYPVDVVAATVGHVARQLAAGEQFAPGAGFHYFNPEMISFDEIAVTLRRAGFPVRRLPYPQWRAELVRRAEQGEELALGAFAPLLPEEEPPDTLPSFDCRQAQRYAAAAGTACPPADGTLLRRYLDWFVRTGYLPRPGA